MWGKIENNKVTKIYKYPEQLRDASGTLHPKATFKSNTKLAEFYIYPVINTNIQPSYPELYSGVGESYAWNEKNSQIDRTYNYSAKSLDDETDSDGVVTEGIKTILKRKVSTMQSSLLSSTDKWIIRKADTDENIPTTVATYRSSIRSSATTMETAITNAKTFDAIVSLLTTVYNTNGSVKTPATLYNFPAQPDDMPE
jgi:hypothetical protein